MLEAFRPVDAQAQGRRVAQGAHRREEGAAVEADARQGHALFLELGLLREDAPAKLLDVEPDDGGGVEAQVDGDELVAVLRDPWRPEPRGSCSPWRKYSRRPYARGECGRRGPRGAAGNRGRGGSNTIRRAWAGGRARASRGRWSRGRRASRRGRTRGRCRSRGRGRPG